MKQILSLVIISLIILSSFQTSFASPIDVNVPPTRAFAKVYSDSNHVIAKNYLGQINVTGGSGISVSLANGTTAPSLTITNTASSGLGKIQGSNLGTLGTGIFAGNFNSSMLQFYKLISTNSNCVISSNSTNVILDCSSGGSSGQTLDTMQNLGGGTAIYSGNNTNTNFQFNTLTATGSSSISSSSNLVTIYTHTYQNNTGTSLGTNGVDIYKGMSGTVLQFAKFVSGNANCVITGNSTNDILTCVQPDPAPQISINGNNRTTFTGIIANVTLSAPKVVINGNNRSSFSGIIANVTLSAPKVVINGNNRSSFSGIVANMTFPAPKISINGNNRSSFIAVANTTSANIINGHSVSFPSTNSGTILLANGSLSSLTGTLQALIGVTTLSNSGHVSTFPLNTGTLLQANGSGSQLTGISPSTLTNAGHVSTAPLNTGTILDTNGTLTGTVSGATLSGTLAGTPTFSGNLAMTSKMTTYNNIVTKGIGLVPVYNMTSQKSETTTADPTLLTYTPPASAGTYRLTYQVDVASATSGVISLNVSYTDSNGNALSNNAMPLFQQGTAAPNTTFTTSAASRYSGSYIIDVNNAQAKIIVKWVGGGTSSSKVTVLIEQLG